jgi:flavodoxin
MKVLVAYDSVSTSKMTMKVAQTIAEALRGKGVDVDLLSVGDVDKSAVKNYGFLIAGGPTMAFRPSRGIAQFLDSLPRGDFNGKKGSAFDTQVQSAVSGNASKGIEKKLESLGFVIFKEPLVVYVKGAGKNSYEFKDGELEKAKNWAEEAAKSISV